MIETQIENASTRWPANHANSRAALRGFVEKTVDVLRNGINVLIVDLFPPCPRDTDGIYKVIRDEIEEEGFTFPRGKDRILASYETGGQRTAYVEPIAVGDELPETPLFLTNHHPVQVPLDSTYHATWEVSPEEFRKAVDTASCPILMPIRGDRL